MTIDKMILTLETLKNKVGGAAEVPIVTVFGENDYINAEYAVIGDLEDQDGNKFKCAFVGNSGGEELTKKGVPHYKWNPRDDEMKCERTLHDGYVSIAKEDRKKFPEPTIIDMKASMLYVKMSRLFGEDAYVDGEPDDNLHPNMPGYDEKDDSVSWVIDVQTGTILNWKRGVTAKTNYKVVDEFEYDYDGFHYGPDYVPDFMGIDDKSYGDYVCVTVDENGKIRNWSEKRFLSEHCKLRDEADE